jgi:hypothetical protein
MIDQLIIPSPDAMPVPAPIWLLKVLLLLTFLLHIIPMNIALGGSFTAFVTDLLGRKRNSEYHLRLARSFSKAIPIATAFTITLGVAPLLFLQVLYGQLFYTSSILMAWPWLAVIGLLILAYYGFYLYQYRWERLQGARLWVVLVSALFVFVIGLIYTNNVTLMLAPEKFSALYHSNPSGTHWNFDEPTVIPRYLHFFVASFAVTGLLVVLFGLGKLKTDGAYGRWAVRYGGTLFIVATVIQMAVGIWFLLALPTDVMMLFMGRNVLATALLGAGILLPIVSMMLMVLAIKSEQPKSLAAGSISVLGLVLVVMVIMRDIVRDGYLAGKFDVFDRVVEPQWGVMALFAVILVVGLSVVGYMLTKVVRANAHATEIVA